MVHTKIFNRLLPNSILYKLGVFQISPWLSVLHNCFFLFFVTIFKFPITFFTNEIVCLRYDRLKLVLTCKYNNFLYFCTFYLNWFKPVTSQKWFTWKFSPLFSKQVTRTLKIISRDFCLGLFPNSLFCKEA